ncbi:hypothetical protein HDU82_007597 [Entophlyctis luteolus]|nr:hypothetical protein HDU82_007597 [Entophlyctis luteolus]
MRHDDCMVIPVNSNDDCLDFADCVGLDLASCLLPPPLPSSSALAQIMLSPESSRHNYNSRSNSQMIHASDGALVPVDQLGIYECMLVLRPQPSQQEHQSYAVIPTPAMSPAPTGLSSQNRGFSGCSSPLALVNGFCAATSPLAAPQIFLDNIFFPPSSSPTVVVNEIGLAAGSPPRRSSTSGFSRQSSASPAPLALAAASSGGRVAECVNCKTRETSVWRKDEHGRTICNACGLYKKQRGYDRPAVFPFRKSVVRKRARQPNGSAHKSKQVQKLGETHHDLDPAAADGFSNLFST